MLLLFLLTMGMSLHFEYIVCQYGMCPVYLGLDHMQHNLKLQLNTVLAAQTLLSALTYWEPTPFIKIQWVHYYNYICGSMYSKEYSAPA